MDILHVTPQGEFPEEAARVWQQLGLDEIASRPIVLGRPHAASEAEWRSTVVTWQLRLVGHQLRHQRELAARDTRIAELEALLRDRGLDEAMDDQTRPWEPDDLGYLGRSDN